MVKIVFAVAIALAAMGVTADLYAEEMHQHEHEGSGSSEAMTKEAEPVQEEGIVNSVCPVMGGEVGKDTPYKTVYKGKTIGFCCPDCIEKFNAEPEKYMAKIEGAKKECVIKCPECGAEIDVTKQRREGKMKGVCPMMEKIEPKKEEGDEHKH